MVSLPELAACIKHIAEPPNWSDLGPLWKVARVALTMPELNLEGMYLRLKAPNLRDGSGFLLQTEFQFGRSARTTEPLARVEWRIGHTNPGLGPSEYRLLECLSTHHHSFDLNHLPDEDRMRRGNLPLAAPVEPEPATFEEFLDSAGKLLRIKGLEVVSRPEFQGSLLS